MALELQILALAGLLAVAQLAAFAVLANLELPQSWLVGPRDEAMPRALSPLCARMQRAFNNHVEGLVLFAVAVVAVVAGQKSSPVTEGAAVTYLVARIAYAPVYWAGVPWVRSALWALGMAATVVMLIAALG
ncbi:MAG: MAPEG family protein [Pseudomonadota bacterium]